MFEHRTLMMKANRMFGANLVDHNLIKFEDLEAANERFLDAMADSAERPLHLLNILLYEKQSLKEEALLALQAEEMGLGIIDPRIFDISDEIKARIDIPLCWATASIPFDREEDTFSVASCYYLSSHVREHWSKTLGGPIVWFVTSLQAFTETLDALQNERTAARKAANVSSSPPQTGRN